MSKLTGFLSVIGAVAAVAVATPPVAFADGTKPGVANFLSAVNTINDELRELSAEKSLSPNDFHLANLQTFTNPGNAAVLARAIQKNSAQITVLREALSKNAIVSRVLANANVSVDQVVALDVQPGVEFTIYYQPPG
jgi:hypothetical protein